MRAAGGLGICFSIFAGGLQVTVASSHLVLDIYKLKATQGAEIQVTLYR
jgi:hypothetical protein